MNCYYGEVHSHTTESDGKGGTPEEAYRYARDVGHADYFSVTDHSTYLTDDRFGVLIPSVAEKMNVPEHFAALWGYEMSYDADSGYFGHLNVYGLRHVEPISTPLFSWYEKLAGEKQKLLGEFNHPGEKWGDFEEFAYNRRLDDIFNLIELRIDEYGIPVIEEEYDRCLRRGWHVGPVSNEDTHGANWTTQREETGAVLAPELSAESIAEAMHARRTFATTDRTFRIFYTANGAWMGSVLKKTGKLHIRVEAFTEKECGIGILQAVGEQNIELARIHAGTEKHVIWEFDLPDCHSFVYIRRTAMTHYAVTAPVFVEQPQTLSLAAECHFTQNGTEIEVTCENVSNGTLNNLHVTWWNGCGRILPDDTPLGEAQIVCLAPGESAGICRLLQIPAGKERIVVTVSGETGEEVPVFAEKSLHVCPVMIRQVFASTARYTADRYTQQPFSCFDLYNSSARDCDLSPYTFRIYTGAGLAYRDLILDRVLPPHGTLTVWLRGVKPLDAGDFNEAFGTRLREGEDLLIADTAFNCPEGTRKILICRGNRTLCRAWVRGGSLLGKTIPTNASIVYERNFESKTLHTVGLCEHAVPGGNVPIDGHIQDIPFAASEKTADPHARSETITRYAVCLSDGGIEAAGLREAVRCAFPDVVLTDVLTGNNTGADTSDRYFREEGEKLLSEAAESGADTVILAIGLCDCGHGRLAWLSRNYLSLSTLLEGICLYLRLHGKKVRLLLPPDCETDRTDFAALGRALYDVCGTVGCSCNVPVKRLILPAVRLSVTKGKKPAPGAKRIAAVGGLYTAGGNGALTSYAEHLQRMEPDTLDVGIYARSGAVADKQSHRFWLKYASCEWQALKEFAPSVVLLWLAMEDLKIAHAQIWEKEYRRRYLDGLSELVKSFREIGAQVILISPFCRHDRDLRMQMMLEKDGMAQSLMEFARQEALPLVDLVTPTLEDSGLVAVGPRNTQYLSEKGNEFLASLVADCLKESGL